MSNIKLRKLFQSNNISTYPVTLITDCVVCLFVVTFELSNTKALEFVTCNYSLEGYGLRDGYIRSSAGYPGSYPGVNICGGYADDQAYQGFRMGDIKFNRSESQFSV